MHLPNRSISPDLKSNSLQRLLVDVKKSPLAKKELILFALNATNDIKIVVAYTFRPTKPEYMNCTCYIRDCGSLYSWLLSLQVYFNCLFLIN